MVGRTGDAGGYAPGNGPAISRLLAHFRMPFRFRQSRNCLPGHFSDDPEHFQDLDGVYGYLAQFINFSAGLVVVRVLD